MRRIVSFNNVQKKFKEREILSSVSFVIYDQDVVGLLGPSGIGKTTILKLAAGLETATSGKVAVNAGKVGYVFQEPRLFPWKTALENVMLPLKANGLDKAEAKVRGISYLEAMGLGDFLDYYPAHLSGGMAQRVSLARAFAIEPDLLLLDEPFSSLDVKLRKGVLEMTKNQIKQQPVTVFYVSHSPAEVTQIANRIFVISPGGRLSELPPTEWSEWETQSDEWRASPVESPEWLPKKEKRMRGEHFRQRIAGFFGSRRSKSTQGG